MMEINHVTTQKIEFYKVYLDGKEFNVKVTYTQRHHKNHPETADIEVTQLPSHDDKVKIHESIIKELKGE